MDEIVAKQAEIDRLEAEADAIGRDLDGLDAQKVELLERKRSLARLRNDAIARRQALAREVVALTRAYVGSAMAKAREGR